MDKTLFFDLYAIPRMTESRLKNLLQMFRTPERIFTATREELLSVPGIDEDICGAICNYRRSKELEERIKAVPDVRIVTYLEDDYPVNLKGVPHMPPVLFIKGEITEEDSRAVAIVGTRSPSYYGRHYAQKIAQELASYGVTIISGLARGVDTLAHKGALSAGGRTIAVLGCGIDVYYPRENRSIYEEIVRQGAVVSEYPLGMEPLAINFPKRNRIISGLSKIVVAIEAGEKSGVLNTCFWAKEQGREVYALPGRIDDEKSIGTNRLIKNGGKILTEVTDLLERLGISPKEERKVIELSSEEEKMVWDILSGEPLHIDEICEAIGIPMQKLLNVLFQMELKGMVSQLPGKFFIRTV